MLLLFIEWFNLFTLLLLYEGELYKFIIFSIRLINVSEQVLDLYELNILYYISTIGLPIVDFENYVFIYFDFLY